MEFRDISWANLVFVSVLNEERHREDIADIWDIEAANLYTGEADKELQRLYEVQILSKDGDGFAAKLKSQSFRTELESYMETFHSEDFVEDILDNVGEFHRFLQREDFREHVFNIDRIKEFYNNEPKEAKDNPLEIFVLVAAGLAGEADSFDSDHNPEPLLEALEKLKKETRVTVF